MPKLATTFSTDVGRAMRLPSAGEAVRILAPPGSPISKHVTMSVLEALYEMAYMRIFADWELFLEETFVRMLCGYASPVWVPQPRQPKQSDLLAARALMLAGRQFVLWWNPYAVRARAIQFFVNSPHELVVGSSLARLEAFANVRHRLGHGSKSVRQGFDSATMVLAGRRYRGGAVGRFLRDWDTAAAPPIRWLNSMSLELGSLANQIAP